jgi:Carboxypeptidase regulatory-like domain
VLCASAWYPACIGKISRLVRALLCNGALILIVGKFLFPVSAVASTFEVSGIISDPAGRPIAGANVELVRGNGIAAVGAVTGPAGRFQLSTESAGAYNLIVRSPGFRNASKVLAISLAAARYEVNLSLGISSVELVTVTTDVDQVDLFSPDPAEKVFVQQDLIDANPGRPGAPVSIPGLPIETASGGIKAPQYFAPGVAADHGEPIAQFIAVGGYLLPNNLSANAHGNGYADPNILIPQVLADVQVDGGSFNVLEGNHAVNLAATYGLRSRVAPFLTLSGDFRDIDIATGFSSGEKSWVALEASYGNGFLKRLEHRQQYKVNAERVIEARQHRFTLLGIGYYGFSYIPGLVPIGATSSEPGCRGYG